MYQLCQRSQGLPTYERRCIAFTLIELLIIVVILSIVAGVVVRFFDNSVDVAEQGVMRSNEQLLRSAIERYKADHNGAAPVLRARSLPQLVSKTNSAGQVGTGADYAYGPYVGEIPVNPLNSSNEVQPTDATTIKNIALLQGWWYQTETGRIWAGRRKGELRRVKIICP